jgi:hypothetical protein
MPQLTLNNHLLYNMLSYTSPSVAPCKGTPIPSVCIVFPEGFYWRTRPDAFAWPHALAGRARRRTRTASSPFTRLRRFEVPIFFSTTQLSPAAKPLICRCGRREQRIKERAPRARNLGIDETERAACGGPVDEALRAGKRPENSALAPAGSYRLRAEFPAPSRRWNARKLLPVKPCSLPGRSNLLTQPSTAS